MLVVLIKTAFTRRWVARRHCFSHRGGSSPAFFSCVSVNVIIACSLLALFVIPTFAIAVKLPLPGLTDKKTAQKTAQPVVLTDESIEQSRSQLESRLTELHQQLRPEAIAELQRTYRELASSQELAEWEQLMNRLTGILDEHINSLLRLRGLRIAKRDSIAEVKAWQGFTEKPPYPLSLLDSIRDAIDGKRTSLHASGVILATVEGELEELSAKLKESGKQLRLAKEALETSSGKSDELRKRWQLVLVQLRDQVNQSGVVLAELKLVYFREALAKTQTEINLLEQKLADAGDKYRFTTEELQLKIQAIDNRRLKLGQELEQAVQAVDDARKQLTASEKAVSRAEADLSRPGADKAMLGRLLKDREVSQAIFEAADFRVQILKGMMQLLKDEKTIWRDRHRIISSPGSGTEMVPSSVPQKNVQLINTWKEYVSSKISSLEALIRNQQDKLTNATLDRYELDAARRLVTIYQGQEVLLRRGVELLSEFERLEQRRNEEAQRAAAHVSLEGRLREAWESVSSLARKIWYAELYVAEETIIAEGKAIVRPRSVTVGKLLQALLILLAGTLVLRRLKRPIHWFAVNRLRFDESNALLYTRLLTYLMFIGVLVGSLIFVNIPLAIFAFFGGALAIGIGFGAQNLINNFISGLILMFDRTIRLGDVVELDIHRGRVTAIGMRNSRVKRFDGVEMLVPNSQFLQQNVINWTLSDRRVRYMVTVGVAYGSSTRDTARVILKAVTAQPEVLNDPPPYVTFDNFADSSLNFSAYFWLEMDPAMNSLEICSDIRHRIGEMLGEAGISIPFPQRDLHLRTIQPLEIRISGPDN